MSGFSITLTAPAPERDELIAELWDAGTVGITEDADWLRAFFDESTNASELMRRFSRYQPHFERDDDRDWVAHAQAMWSSLAVGDRFYLVPEWLDDPAPCGRVRLRIRPGLACGSGAHPATQLCLQALESTVSDDTSVLDVGTGSGILAEAAELLGAAPVLACDIDHSATVVAKSNLASGPFAPGLFTGSLRSVRSASVDVVVANLNAATISSLAPEFGRVARRNVVLSGFREDESSTVTAAVGRTPARQLEMDDWACLIF